MSEPAPFVDEIYVFFIFVRKWVSYAKERTNKVSGWVGLNEWNGGFFWGNETLLRLCWGLDEGGGEEKGGRRGRERG